MPASAGTPSSRFTVDSVTAQALEGTKRNAPGEPRRIGLLYTLPAVALFATFVVLPLVDGLWLSLFQWDGVGPRHWVGLDNYGALFHDPTARQRLRARPRARDSSMRSCR